MPIALGEIHSIIGDWRLVLFDLLLIPVLFANGNRTADAGTMLRWIWHRGRSTLLFAYIGSSLLFIFLQWDILKNSYRPEFPYLFTMLCLEWVAIAYLLRSRHVRDLFADFPEPEAEVQPAQAPAATVSRVKLARISQGQELLVKHPLPPAAQGSIEDHLRQHLTADNPDDAVAWHTLGMQAMQAGKLEQATDFVRQASQCDGANALYLRDLGSLCLRQGLLEESLTALQVAIRLRPEDADAQFFLGVAWMQSNRSNEATGCFHTVLQLNPNHAQSWNNLGVLFRLRGDEDAACEAFEQALRIAPEMAEARNNFSLCQQAKSASQ